MKLFAGFGVRPKETEPAVTSCELDRPGLSVRIDGGWVDHGMWLIHAVAVYRPHLTVEATSDVQADGRRELILAIAGEARAARERGARSVYVVVEGDDEVAGFFRILNPRLRRGARRDGRGAKASVSP